MLRGVSKAAEDIILLHYHWYHLEVVIYQFISQNLPSLSVKVYGPDSELS